VVLSCATQAETCYRITDIEVRELLLAPALPDYRAPLEVRHQTAGVRRRAHREPSGKGLESGVFRLVITAERTGAQGVVEGITNLSELAWSPEGECQAYCEGALLYTIDSSGTHRRLLYAGPGGAYPGACFDLSWSADGARLCFTLIENLFRPELAHPMRITLGLQSADPSPAVGDPYEDDGEDPLSRTRTIFAANWFVIDFLSSCQATYKRSYISKPARLFSFASAICRSYVSIISVYGKAHKNSPQEMRAFFRVLRLPPRRAYPHSRRSSQMLSSISSSSRALLATSRCKYLSPISTAVL
jgi:hypothetical protein